MRSYFINSYGSEDVLETKLTDIPVVATNQILVKIHSFGVNPVDWKIRKGELRFFSRYRFPRSLGSDFAGEIAQIGNNILDFKIGDKVFGFVDPFRAGAYSNYIVVYPRNIVISPSHLSYEEASVCALAGVTAIKALTGLACLQANHSVLVNGASGGVGSFAVQICKAMGVSVTAVCSERNIPFVRGLGADLVIDYNQTDWTCLDKKFDLIFDTVGSSSYDDCKVMLNSTGTYISTLPKIRHLWSVFFTFFARKKAKLVVVSPERDSLYLQRLAKLLASASIKPCLDRIYSFSDLKSAHRYSETKRAVGKIAVRVDT